MCKITLGEEKVGRGLLLTECIDLVRMASAGGWCVFACDTLIAAMRLFFADCRQRLSGTPRRHR